MRFQSAQQVNLGVFTVIRSSVFTDVAPLGLGCLGSQVLHKYRPAGAEAPPSFPLHSTDTMMKLISARYPFRVLRNIRILLQLTPIEERLPDKLHKIYLQDSGKIRELGLS